MAAIRRSKQRDAIKAYLMSTTAHPTAEVVYENIKKDFPNALCSEMEASAVGHTCYKFGVPFIITRSLSDVYGHGESSMQFDEYLKIASENSAKLCVELVKA